MPYSVDPASKAARRYGAAVLDEVRTAVQRELDRVGDPTTAAPGGDPSDVSGWYPSNPPAGVGRPFYNHEVWRWFQLVDLAYLDEMVLVEFFWNDPSAPSLRYVLICHVDQLDNATDAAMVVRSTLRSSLAPGWQHRLGHRWIGGDRVLLWRIDERAQQARDAHWWWPSE